MSAFLAKFTDSYGEMKKTSSLVGVSLLLAMSIVLSYVLRLELGPELRIGLAFVATALMGMLYGPVAAGFAAGAGDLIKYVLRPSGPYFFGFTLNAILAGVVYGLFFYKGKAGLTRIVLAKTVVNVALNGLLNTYWLSILYGDAYGVLLWPRIIKNVTMLPIEIGVLFLALGAISRVLVRLKKL